MTLRSGGPPGSAAALFPTSSRIRRASGVPSRRRADIFDSTERKDKPLRPRDLQVPAQVLHQSTTPHGRDQSMRFLTVTLCASLTLPAAAGLAQSEFGMARLAEGKEAFIQKRYSEAVEDFRVAGFALLDHPPRLLECLVRRAVAQSAGGYSDEDRKASVSRFLETERRFPLYRELDLEPEIRRTFETILRRDVPPEVLAGMPELEMTSASTTGIPKGAKTPGAVPPVPSATAVMKMASTPHLTERTPEPETGAAPMRAPGA